MPEGSQPGERFTRASSAALPLAYGRAARHRPVVEWAVQLTNHPAGDPRGLTYRLKGWGFESV